MFSVWRNIARVLSTGAIYNGSDLEPVKHIYFAYISIKTLEVSILHSYVCTYVCVYRMALYAAVSVALLMKSTLNEIINE